MPKGGSPSQNRDNSGRYGGSRGGGLGGRGNSNRDSGRDGSKFSGRETRGFHGGGINTRDFQDRPQVDDNRDGGGGVVGRAVDALTRDPLRAPTKTDPGIIGTMVGVMPGPIGLALGLGSLVADEMRRAGFDVRNRPFPGPGDTQRGENRRGLLTSGGSPDDDAPSPSTPEPSTPGDPSNLGARGRRRRLTDFTDSGASQRRLLSLG
jgi:hypothetical protein